MTDDKNTHVKYRAFKLSLGAIDLLESLPKNYIYATIGKQLLRSITSIGANVVEAQAGRTKKDFANYYQIALKSSNESKYWLSIIKSKSKNQEVINETGVILSEVIEISKILGASLVTLRKDT